ncbi:SusC/RagA family TonB-linked outer membrane protein [Adhaeribacter aerolatus]|uniref:SusC/RagA family TonB-linked outer membrane protein n=1 Tax=Adhaeribacter aerolatus TaxID=670289 RepID=A0A512AYI7_9BACT|nr:TonB-dependent receptor [Adhaeribacter aerolatus]GEO04778.1 SusC/RagA family TonB-linked outer membrane protein [Adhaeribacter aerolatus]
MKKRYPDWQALTPFARKFPVPFLAGKPSLALLVLFISLVAFIYPAVTFAAIPVRKLQTVTGRVTDADNGEPLPGVSIVLKGTNLGTTTDAGGNYSLEVAHSEAVLVFTFVGYLKKEIPVKGQTTLQVSLAPNQAQLDEVVVIGYGTVKKSSVTAAVSKIENNKLDQIPVARPETALVGRLSGVNISTNRSTPGASPIIRIRGAGSISASNDPLVVIDGFPGGSLDNVNMNDVESIEVLKDASSAAIYGSRGNGGVIIVTTKKGKSSKPQLNFNAYTGVARAIGHDDWITGQEFHDYVARYHNREFVWAGGDPTIPLWGDVRRPAQYQVNPVVKEGNTVWEEVLLKPAPIQNYNLSVAGGTDNAKYYVSGTLRDEKGTLLNTGYKYYSLRANLDLKINSVVSTGFMVNPNYSIRRTAPLSMEALVKTSPFVSPVRNANGTYPKPLDYWGSSVSAQVSPLATLEGTTNTTDAMNTIGEAFVNLNILKNLTFRTSLGGNVTFTTAENYSKASANSNGLNNGSASDATNINLLNENVFSYTKSFNDIHYISAIAGASFQKNTSRLAAMGVLAGSFGNEAIRTLNNAVISPTTTRTTKSQWGLASYFSRINYSFRDKYLLAASFRTDGSSKFGPNNRWGNFPSASAAWRVSQEEFIQDLPVISDLKLRASYGVVGNFNITDFGYFGNISDVYYAPNGILTKGQAQTTLGYPTLRWERTKSYDIGLELGLFNSRLNVVLDYYDKNTDDLLYNVSVPSVSGFTNALVNTGVVNNKGIELELNSKNLTGALTWSTAFNVTRNRNKVVDLGGVNEIINTHTRGMSWLLRVGEPAFSYYGYKAIGVLQDAEDIANSPTLPGSRPGNAKYQDTNNDGKITPADRIILGNFQPKLILGMVNDFAYKNFDLSIMMQASLGAKMYNLENLYYQGATVSAMRRSLVENQWWSEAEPGNGKEPATALSALAYVSNSDFYLEDASFLAIRNVNLGYQFPAAIAQKMRMNNLRVYLTMSNALMLTKRGFHGYNPEGYTGGEITGINSMPGFNNGSEPLNRTVALGLNVNF